MAVQTIMAQTIPSLRVSDEPLPSDLRLEAYAQADAPIGQVLVHIGLGKGSRGRGTRIGDDPVALVSVALRFAAHLTRFAIDWAVEDARERDVALQDYAAQVWQLLAPVGQEITPALAVSDLVTALQAAAVDADTFETALSDAEEVRA